MVGFDDGTGWALYICGGHSPTVPPTIHVARWSGGEWTNVPGTNASAVNALAVFDDGSGPALFAGGFAPPPGGGSGWNGLIARWDGQTWTHLNTGINGAIAALGAFDDGVGTALYVGGHFTQAGGAPANYIARWDGQNWSPLGSGLGGTVHAVEPFYDDPNGAALYVGGLFQAAGGVPAAHIARWDGQNWSALGAGVNGIVRSLASSDDGTGPAIYASGDFSEPAPWFARWDGFAWSPVGSIMNEIAFAMARFDAGDGPHLYAAGPFTSAGPYAARWDGTQWSGFLDFVPASHARAMTTTNDGAPAVYIGFNSLSGSTYARFGCEPAPPPCYPDCDGNELLNIDDFICFVSEFAAAQGLPPAQQAQHYANCDQRTDPPILSIDDFICFINAFARGCP